MSDTIMPRSCTELFLAFNRLALQGFGGVLAVAQIELVERRRWLTREEFVELLSASQVLPGPNIVNLSLMLGDRWFGWRGAISALGGLIVVPLAIVMALTLFYDRFSSVPAVAGALRGMGAVAAGLVMVTAFKLVGTLRKNRLGPWWCLAVAAATFGAIALARLPLAGVIVTLGPATCLLAWWKLRP